MALVMCGGPVLEYFTRKAGSCPGRSDRFQIIRATWFECPRAPCFYILSLSLSVPSGNDSRPSTRTYPWVDRVPASASTHLLHVHEKLHRHASNTQCTYVRTYYTCSIGVHTLLVGLSKEIQEKARVGEKTTSHAKAIHTRCLVFFARLTSFLSSLFFDNSLIDSL